MFKKATLLRISMAGSSGFLAATLAIVPLLTGAAYAQSSSPATVVVTPDPVMLRASAVRDRFIAAIGKCGGTPTYLPSIVANNPDNGIDYNDGDHAVHISRWSKLAPPVQEAMAEWAQQGTLGLSPEAMWGEIFNEFLVAHELGHYLESMSGRIDKMDNWQSEIDADRIALAFWSIDRTDAALLSKREQNYSRFLLSLPSPVPAGMDDRRYFQTDYETLGKNLSAYGWYQGQFMKIAMSQHGQLSFCDWVKDNLPVNR